MSYEIVAIDGVTINPATQRLPVEVYPQAHCLNDHAIHLGVLDDNQAPLSIMRVSAHQADPHTMIIDGRDVSADGAKLDTVEMGAEVNNLTDQQAQSLTSGTHSNWHTHDLWYYRKSELQASGQAAVHWGNLINVPSMFTPPVASSVVLGGVKVGANVTVDSNGVISVAAPYTLPVATTSTLGGVKVGTNISIDSNGAISVSLPAAYTLPTASATILGGVKIGSNITIDENGVISATDPYTLPVATTSTLGGVKIGSGVAVDGAGTISVTPYTLPAATPSSLGGVVVGFGLSVISGTISVIFSGSGTAVTSSKSDHTHPNDSSIGGPFYTQVNLQTGGQSQVNWANVTNKPTFGGNNWLPPVKSQYTGNVAPSGATPAGSNGDRIIWYSGTGSNQHVYQMASGAWADVYAPSANDTVMVADDGDGKGAQYWFNGTTWIKISDQDWGNHASLSGLANDDHPQYRNGTLAFTGSLNMGGFSVTSVGTVDGVQVSTHDHSGTGKGGTVDHTKLAGIGTKTHAQIDTHIADTTVHFTAATVSHSVLQSLGNDDHVQYSRSDGTRAFTATVSGITPTQSAHLATKGYVDSQDSSASLYAFKTIAGITNNVVATAIADTLTLASGNSALTIVGTIASKTVTLTVNSGGISHSALADLGSDDHTQYLNAARHSAISGNPHSTTLAQVIAADATANSVTVANLNALENGSDAGTLHTHDGRYYSKTSLQTSGQASVNWANLTNTPSTFTPPAATTATLGGVIVGNGLSVAGGVLSVNGSVSGSLQAAYNVGSAVVVSGSNVSWALGVSKGFLVTDAVGNQIIGAYGNNTSGSWGLSGNQHSSISVSNAQMDIYTDGTGYITIRSANALTFDDGFLSAPIPLSESGVAGLGSAYSGHASSIIGALNYLGIQLGSGGVTAGVLQLTNQTTAPTGGSGKVAMINNDLYFWDATRSKWLTPSKTCQCAKSGHSAGYTLRWPDGTIGSGQSGVTFHRKGTITGVGINTVTTGSPAVGMLAYLQLNGSNVATLTFDSSGDVIATSINVNFNPHDVVSILMNDGATDMMNPIANIEYCWRPS